MSQSDAATSLLSLSIAAATASPIPLHQRSTSLDGMLESGTPAGNTGSHKAHRRLASMGKTKRRLSDAREAAARPSPAILASPPVLSIASLSLSTSPGSPAADSSSPKAIPIGTGKKRGVEHKCESCSKIYRHPSCLIKHRWEHTPHWREASKFVLSKHQQVQLLEAAAILSHLSPSSSSLPDDRSLWPSFLSGGSLPPPDPSTLMSTPRTTAAPNGGPPAAVSSSVPLAGPRMHDYSIPLNSSSTQLRPGLLSVPTSQTSSTPTNGIIPVTSTTSQAQSMSVPITSSHSWSSVSVSNVDSATGTAGWSLPRSSVRSVSASSRSRSGSASDDEQDPDVADEDDDDLGSYDRRLGRRRYGFGAYSHHRTQQPKLWKREEDDMGMGSWREEDEYLGANKTKEEEPAKEWDGMDMDMDMD